MKLLRKHCVRLTWVGRYLALILLALLHHASSAAAQTPAATVYSLQVVASPQSATRYEEILVTITVLRDGIPSGLWLASATISVETAPGTNQEEANPVLLPAAPIHDTSQSAFGSRVYTFTTAAPDLVEIAATVYGEGEFEGPGGEPIYQFTSVTARSQPIEVLDAWQSEVSMPLVHR